jgi:hypothetical protein
MQPWLVNLRQFVVVIALFMGGLFLGMERRTEPTVPTSSASQRLQPVTTSATDASAGGTVYVPVYSSIYLGLDPQRKMVELSATVSVRNVSARHPIILDSVRYYDSTGKPIREYLEKPSELPPLATVEFIIQRGDARGGPGANFLIHWKGQPDADAPLTEAIMIGQSGSAGISFTSVGRAVNTDSTAAK